MDRRLSVGVNGFGRFGKHLLRYWALNYSKSGLNIDYINDDYLSLAKAYELIITDDYLVDLAKIISIEGEGLRVNAPGLSHKILFTHKEPDQIPWIGIPDMVMETSGKLVGPGRSRLFSVGNTKRVLISATSVGADQTLVYGYNLETFDPNSKLISYGSCTINAYVPLAAYLHDRFCITDSDANIIHNVPEYKMLESKTLQRKECTLSFMGPQLLPFLNRSNFQVNYTNVPYSGVSIMDLRFRLRYPPSKKVILELLSKDLAAGSLKGLYGMTDRDYGPEAHKFTDASGVIVASSAKIKGHNLYLQMYFDNENSVNRYFDLANFLTKNPVRELVHGQ